jgi:hypothetical protein
MSRLLLIIAGVLALYACQNVAYIKGFDDGSTAAQCLDFYAWAGPKDAMAHKACIDAAKAQRSIHFKVLGHRVFFQ